VRAHPSTLKKLERTKGFGAPASLRLRTVVHAEDGGANGGTAGIYRDDSIALGRDRQRDDLLNATGSDCLAQRVDGELPHAFGILFRLGEFPTQNIVLAECLTQHGAT
jgi:hypothetical protein